MSDVDGIVVVAVDNYDGTYTVSVFDRPSDLREVAGFDCSVEDLPALVDAHIVALIGGAG